VNCGREATQASLRRSEKNLELVYLHRHLDLQTYLVQQRPPTFMLFVLCEPVMPASE